MPLCRIYQSRVWSGRNHTSNNSDNNGKNNSCNSSKQNAIWSWQICHHPNLPLWKGGEVEDKITKKEKRSGWSRVKRAMEHSKSQSAPALPSRKEGSYPDKAKNLPISTLRIHHLPSPYQHPNHSLLKKQKNPFLMGQAIYQLDRKALEKGIFLHRGRPSCDHYSSVLLSTGSWQRTQGSFFMLLEYYL